MAQIIKTDSVSQDQIIENIQEYIQTLPNYDDIKDTLDSSAIQTIIQLLAGTGTWSLFNYNRLRNETYLSQAIKDSSVFSIARQFGYNISRANAPTVTLKYTGSETIVLEYGSVLGTAGDYEIIYFGDAKFIEYGDRVSGYVGVYKSENFTAQYDDDGAIYKDLAPEDLTSIDNELVSINTTSSKYEISKAVEDYCVYNEVVDYSIDNVSARLYIADKTNSYGLYNSLTEGASLTVHWVETDGYYDGLTTADVSPIDSNWTIVAIASQGSDSESADKVKTLAPFYYSTLRRAVTSRDYTYLAKAHSYIKDAYSVTESGVSGVWQLTALTTPVESATYSITLNSNLTYSVIAESGETTSTLLEKFKEKIDLSGWASAEVDSSIITITNLNARVDMDPVGSSNMFSTTTTLTEQETPPCCTQDIFYIKHNQTRDGGILALTESERLTYASYLQDYKMAGVTVVLAPATREQYQIDLTISVENPDLVTDDGVAINEYIKEQVAEILETNYEFQLNTSFSYAEFIAQVTKIEAIVDNSSIQPITSVVANQDTFDLEAKDDVYYVFTEVNLTFV